MRDGDQGEGTGFMPKEKIIVAEILKKMGINVIEAGFARSRSDKSIKDIVKHIGANKCSPTICSLARTDNEDIDAAAEALIGARKGRIHTFIATSEKHINVKFTKYGNNLDERKMWVLRKIEESVKRAKDTGFEVEWSAEDAFNTEGSFLLEACIIAIKNGATIINIPDTLGTASPWGVEELFKFLIEKTIYLEKEGYNFIFSAHCHNDFGNAVSNTLAAIRGGARQVESTILGIGERTGNAAFHIIAGNLFEKGDRIILGKKIESSIKRNMIYDISKLVSDITGRNISENEPFIGSKCAMHGSGVHTSGDIKSKKLGGDGEKGIYDAIKTEDYGTVEDKKTFNARSGSSEIIDILKNYGITLDKNDPIIDAIAKIGTEEAERSRGIYPTRIFSLYLEEKGLFKINDIRVKGINTKLL